MNTTTLTAFWELFASSTQNMVFGNLNFFTIVFVAITAMMILGGLYLVFTAAFKKIGKK